jgi:RHS repeat-associated protein
MTDQNGTVHEYDYDGLGRNVADRATLAFGSAIDDAVLRLETAYDERQRLASVTSYDAATGGSIVNQVVYERNAFGQTIKEFQSHAGAVNVMTTPFVGYEYEDGSANTVRQTKLIYPDGRELNYDFGASDSASDLLSRTASLIDDDGTSVLAAYDYLGVGAIVRCDYVQPDVRWDLSPTGDDFDGLDALDRVIDNLWYDYGSSADADRIQYTYDANGNRLSRKNVVAGSGNDELYAYDPVDRLTDLERGDLNIDRDAITSLDFAQEWTLDATGNWTGFKQDDDGTGWDLTQTRTANEVNEITGISGGSWVAPSYDAAGNMTTLPQSTTPTSGYDGTYDAWNRLVKLVDGMATVAEYAYDPTTRRITVDDGSAVRHAYFTRSWRNLEERLDASTDAERQFVWGLRYVDDLVLRDRTVSTPLDERLYALQDANWNVDAVVDSSGDIQERYRYSAYGTPAFLDAGFTPLSPDESSVEWETLYAGYRYDETSGLYCERSRWLNTSVGTWLTRDPVGLAGGLNLLQYVASRPTTHVDPSGLAPQPGRPAKQLPTCPCGPTLCEYPDPWLILDCNLLTAGRTLRLQCEGPCQLPAVGFRCKKVFGVKAKTVKCVTSLLLAVGPPQEIRIVNPIPPIRLTPQNNLLPLEKGSPVWNPLNMPEPENIDIIERMLPGAVPPIAPPPVLPGGGIKIVKAVGPPPIKPYRWIDDVGVGLSEDSCFDV